MSFKELLIKNNSNLINLKTKNKRKLEEINQLCNSTLPTGLLANEENKIAQFYLCMRNLFKSVDDYLLHVNYGCLKLQS